MGYGMSGYHLWGGSMLSILLSLAGRFIVAYVLGRLWSKRVQGTFWYGALAALFLGPLIGIILTVLLYKGFLDSFFDNRKGGKNDEIFLAVAKDSPDVINYMLLRGARITGKTEIVRKSLLMIAAESNKNPDVCKLLIDNGAKINDKDIQGLTALMWAAKNNPNPDVCRILISEKAAVNEKDNQGMTALMHAAYTNPNPQVFQLLLDTGANPKLLSLQGNSAFDYAERKPNTPLLQSEVFIRLKEKLQISIYPQDRQTDQTELL